MFSSKYIAQNPLRIQGERLLRSLDRGDIVLSGEKGRDWDIGYYTNENGQINSVAGLLLKVDAKTRKWVVPSNDAIKIPDGNRIDYRSYIDGILEPAPRSDELIHWVGETTSKIHLTQGVNAAIEHHTSISLSFGGMADGLDHLASPLIDAGFNGTIRTEIVSPTNDEAPNSIILYLYKDAA